MEVLVLAVQDLLTLHAKPYGFANVVWNPMNHDDLCETSPRIIWRLKEPRDDGGLKGSVELSSFVLLGQFALMRSKSGFEQALPLGVLEFQGVQRSQQRFSLGLGISHARPGADIVISRRLSAVLQLRDLRWWP